MLQIHIIWERNLVSCLKKQNFVCGINGQWCCELWGSCSMVVNFGWFLGILQNCQKEAVGFIMSVRVELLGSHWMDFYKIWYFRVFQKSVKKGQVLLKSDKNNGYFTWRPTYIYDCISPNSSSNEECFRQNL